MDIPDSFYFMQVSYENPDTSKYGFEFKLWKSARVHDEVHLSSRSTMLNARSVKTIHGSLEEACEHISEIVQGGKKMNIEERTWKWFVATVVNGGFVIKQYYETREEAVDYASIYTKSHQTKTYVLSLDSIVEIAEPPITVTKVE